MFSDFPVPCFLSLRIRNANFHCTFRAHCIRINFVAVISNTIFCVLLFEAENSFIARRTSIEMEWNKLVATFRTYNGKSFSKRASSGMNMKIYNAHRMMRIEREQNATWEKKIRLIASPLGNAIIITIQRRIKTATTTKKCRVKSVFILSTNHINNALFILHIFSISVAIFTPLPIYMDHTEKREKNRLNVGRKTEREFWINRKNSKKKNLKLCW